MPLKIFLFLCSLVAATWNTSQAAPIRKVVPTGATSFSSQAGGFSLWLPVKPKQSKTPIDMGDGEIINSYDFETEADFDANSIAYTIQAAMTPFSLDITVPQAQLDVLQQGFLEKSAAKLQKREAIQLGAFPGREIKASLQGGEAVARVRFYITPRFIYTLTAAGFKDDVEDREREQIDRVFASFRVSPQPSRIVPLFAPQGQGFSVRLPLKPVRSQLVAPLDNGKSATVTVFKASTETVNYAVLVTPTDSSVDISDPRGQLDALEGGLLRSISAQSPGANVQSRTEMQLDGFQGRELKISLLQGAATTRARVYFTPKFFFQLIAGGKKADVARNSAQIKAVFDSFRILPQ